MKRLMIVLALLLITGCLPRTSVVKNPSARDTGIRYYRPKPYLMVKPMMAGGGENKTIIDGLVDISIEYLPDFSEEYSIHIRTGLGMNHTQVSLDQGWNLTSVNANMDSKFAENVGAIAGLAEKFIKTTSGPAEGSRMNMQVVATNVPMGLYEAVISCDHSSGKKRLYGFRYVGFHPFAQCPLESCGHDTQPCNESVVYGLIFENGKMVFRSLNELPNRINVPNPAESSLQGILLDRYRNDLQIKSASLLSSNGYKVTAVTIANNDPANPNYFTISATLDKNSSDTFNALSFEEKERLQRHLSQEIANNETTNVFIKLVMSPEQA